MTDGPQLTAGAFPQSVVLALGPDRTGSLLEAARTIRQIVNASPAEGTWTTMVPIRLKAKNEVDAQEELGRHLLTYSPYGDWFAAVGQTQGGGRFGWASDAFSLPGPPTPDATARLLLFDLHSRFAAWWLTHLWRAGDLTDATISCLQEWQAIPAAACGRSLLEGIASFVVEGNQLVNVWDTFKRSGPHSIDEVGEFRESLNSLLSQAQFATRLGHLEKKTPPSLERTNILTILKRFVRDHASNYVLDEYETLCDAVHPSMGSMAAYTAAFTVHSSGATVRAHLARRTAQDANPPINHSNLAWATADVIILAASQLAREAPRIRWAVDDFGITTLAAYSARIPLLGALQRPARNDQCPCASGRKAKLCRHEWGDSGRPPDE